MEIKVLADNISEQWIERIFKKDKLEKCIYLYCSWNYDWRGLLLARNNIWDFIIYNLWHCSCYWPLEQWHWVKGNSEEMKRIIDCDFMYLGNWYLKYKSEFLNFLKNI